MTHKEYADSLRMLADFFEENQAKVRVPHDAETFRFYAVTGKAQMADLLRALGTCKKRFDGDYFRVEKNFGHIKFEAIEYRSKICEAVVVGKKIIPEQIIPEQPSQVIPEHEEDIIEWRCEEPILSEQVDG